MYVDDEGIVDPSKEKEGWSGTGGSGVNFKMGRSISSFSSVVVADNNDEDGGESDTEVVGKPSPSSMDDRGSRIEVERESRGDSIGNDVDPD